MHELIRKARGRYDAGRLLQLRSVRRVFALFLIDAVDTAYAVGSNIGTGKQPGQMIVGGLKSL